MELFNLEVPENKLHPNFKAFKADKSLIDVLNRWSIGFIDRDNKFVKEFQTTFNSSFWELYLHECFQNLGFKPNYTHHAPDFTIETRLKNKILVEAVTTKSADDGTPEHDRIEKLNQLFINEKNHQKLHNEIVHLATERLANSIKNKSRKYITNYSKELHVKDKPFILAIGGFEQPLFYLQGIGAIQRICYGLIKAEYKNSVPYMDYSDHIIKKKNGVEIPIGIFNNRSHSHISAILFSSVASAGKVRALSLRKNKNMLFSTYTYNDYDIKGTHSVAPHKKYRESLLDGLSLYLNPYAENPIDPRDFDNPDIAINYSRDNAKLKHGFLFSRTVINTTTNQNEIRF